MEAELERVGRCIVRVYRIHHALYFCRSVFFSEAEELFLVVELFVEARGLAGFLRTRVDVQNIFYRSPNAIAA